MLVEVFVYFGWFEEFMPGMGAAGEHPALLSLCENFC